jgi:hypothetical protein
VHGLGWLVGDQSDERLAVDRRTEVEHDFRADLHGDRRERDSIGDGDGDRDGGGADGDSGGEPEHGEERQRFDGELEFDQRDGVHGLGWLVGNQGDERLAVNGRSDDE